MKFVADDKNSEYNDFKNSLLTAIHKLTLPISICKKDQLKKMLIDVLIRELALLLSLVWLGSITALVILTNLESVLFTIVISCVSSYA